MSPTDMQTGQSNGDNSSVEDPFLRGHGTEWLARFQPHVPFHLTLLYSEQPELTHGSPPSGSHFYADIFMLIPQFPLAQDLSVDTGSS